MARIALGGNSNAAIVLYLTILILERDGWYDVPQSLWAVAPSVAPASISDSFVAPSLIHDLWIELVEPVYQTYIKPDAS
jgi:hypothetical protein